MNDLTPRLVKCFHAVFPGMQEEEILRADQDVMAQWDSMAMITLVHVIEEEFRISIDSEDLDNSTSFSALRECVGSHLSLL